MEAEGLERKFGELATSNNRVWIWVHGLAVLRHLLKPTWLITCAETYGRFKAIDVRGFPRIVFVLVYMLHLLQLEILKNSTVAICIYDVSISNKHTFHPPLVEAQVILAAWHVDIDRMNLITACQKMHAVFWLKACLPKSSQVISENSSDSRLNNV